MKRRLDLRPALLLLVMGLAARGQPVLIRAGRLVDPDKGTASTGQQIMVENGVIKAVGANVSAPAGAQVVDLSEARTVIIVAGPRGRDMLQKGTPLDLHPRAFEPGHCAQTGLSRANIILHQTDAAPRYDVYVNNSFADYLWSWMERAAAEYGCAVGQG